MLRGLARLILRVGGWTAVGGDSRRAESRHHCRTSHVQLGRLLGPGLQGVNWIKRALLRQTVLVLVSAWHIAQGPRRHRAGSQACGVGCNAGHRHVPAERQLLLRPCAGRHPQAQSQAGRTASTASPMARACLSTWASWITNNGASVSVPASTSAATRQRTWLD